MEIDHSEPRLRDRIFGFEEMMRLAINDGDTSRTSRRLLLNKQVRSTNIIIDRKANIMYIVLFGLMNKKDGEVIKNQGPGSSNRYEGGDR